MSKRKTWCRERQSIQRLLFQKNRRKPWCVWFNSKLQLVNHVYTFFSSFFSGCQRPENRLKESFKTSANGDLWNLPTHQIEWKIHEIKCLRNWNQSMANIETAIGALPNNLDCLKSSRGFRNNSAIYNFWAFFHIFRESDFETWLYLL